MKKMNDGPMAHVRKSIFWVLEADVCLSKASRNDYESFKVMISRNNRLVKSTGRVHTSATSRIV